MASSSSSRTSLKDRRERDARGVDLIFNGPEGEGDTGSAPEGPQAAAKPALAKVTIYVRPEQVTAIEEIQLAERKRTGKRRDKSELVQEALDLLIARYRTE